MSPKLSLIFAEITLRRVIAGLLFVPLLAYTFPPFREMDLPFFGRLVFWSGVMGLAMAATWGSRNLVRGRMNHVGLTQRDVAFALVILVLFTPALWVMTWVLYTACGQDAPGLLAVGTYGALFSTGLVLISKGDTGTEDTDNKGVSKPRLVNRLPTGFHGEILRLTVRDHNVDVVTTEGTFTIRSRFADAISEMDPVSGHCTHRSHWVTDAAILSVSKSKGKTFLRLRNDDLVPVSRKYKPQLEEDGLI
ncbi:MAG: LytTR family DNA-binding domain-containing protein [Ruegeria sp.]